ncbi:MAG: hypothetical protein AAFU77_05760 [Myxococcota bacterium]
MILILQLGTTLFMTGLIWLVQWVHYPLFAHVGREQFSAYEALHTSRISVIVMPMMLLELGSAVALVASPPAGFGRALPLVGLGLLGMVWLTTAAFSVPAHSTLAAGFADGAHASLVSSNWIRTLSWTARSALLLWMTAELLQRGTTS